MTGFGNGSAKTKDVRIDVTIKAVNGRFLDTKIQLPREYSGMESELRKSVAQEFTRGSISVYVTRTWLKRSAKDFVVFDGDWAKEWLKSYRDLTRTVKLSGDLTIDKFVELSGALTVTEKTEPTAQEKKLVLSALASALKSCTRERAREGEALRKSLLSILKDLVGRAQDIAARSEGMQREHEEKLRAKLEKFKLSVAVDESRLAQEVALLADRSDVMEEVVRLAEHLEALQNILVGAGPQGKKADFYIQEIFREVNTIGSKSQSSLQTRDVVELKTLIEQLREQIQNIE